MFRNVTIFRFPTTLDLDELEQALGTVVLKPVGPLELTSAGFISPFGQSSVVLAHTVGRVVWTAVGTEKRLLPASVVNETLAARIAAHEKRTGQRVGGKLRKQLKDDVLTELIPKAFVQPGRLDVSIDRTHGLLAVDTTSRKAAELAASLVRKALGSFPALPLNAETSVCATMTGWLAGEPMPEAFTLGEEVELRGPDGSDCWKGARADLSSEEVRGHLDAGKMVYRLGLTYLDRATFTFGDDLVIRKFKLTDVALDALNGVETDDINGELDARYTLIAAELRQLFQALQEVFKFSPVQG